MKEKVSTFWPGMNRGIGAPRAILASLSRPVGRRWLQVGNHSECHHIDLGVWTQLYREMHFREDDAGGQYFGTTVHLPVNSKEGL
mgnify:CR=1 FL=1